MFTHLKEIYKDPNRLENAKEEFRKLVIKNGSNYHEFLTSFLYLAGEAQISKADLRSEFKNKLSFKLQKLVILAYATTKTFQEFQKQCLIAAHTLSSINARILGGNCTPRPLRPSGAPTRPQVPRFPSQAPRFPRDNSRVQCYCCKGYGHYQTDCPVNQGTTRDQALKELEESPQDSLLENKEA